MGCYFCGARTGSFRTLDKAHLKAVRTGYPTASESDLFCNTCYMRIDHKVQKHIQKRLMRSARTDDNRSETTSSQSSDVFDRYVHQTPQCEQFRFTANELNENIEGRRRKIPTNSQITVSSSEPADFTVSSEPINPVALQPIQPVRSLSQSTLERIRQTPSNSQNPDSSFEPVQFTHSSEQINPEALQPIRRRLSENVERRRRKTPTNSQNPDSSSEPIQFTQSSEQINPEALQPIRRRISESIEGPRRKTPNNSANNNNNISSSEFTESSEQIDLEALQPIRRRINESIARPQGQTPSNSQNPNSSSEPIQFTESTEQINPAALQSIVEAKSDDIVRAYDTDSDDDTAIPICEPGPSNLGQPIIKRRRTVILTSERLIPVYNERITGG